MFCQLCHATNLLNNKYEYHRQSRSCQIQTDTEIQRTASTEPWHCRDASLVVYCLVWTVRLATICFSCLVIREALIFLFTFDILEFLLQLRKHVILMEFH